MSPSYQTVKDILKKGLEQAPLEKQVSLPLDEIYSGEAKYTRPATDMFQ